MAVSKAVLRVYSYIGQHPLTLNDAILRNADVLDRHFNRLGLGDFPNPMVEVFLVFGHGLQQWLSNSY